MEHGLALPISFRFHGVAGEATSFSFSKPDALVDSPKFPSRLAVEPSPFSLVQSILPIDMGGGFSIVHTGEIRHIDLLVSAIGRCIGFSSTIVFEEIFGATCLPVCTASVRMGVLQRPPMIWVALLPAVGLAIYVAVH